MRFVSIVSLLTLLGISGSTLAQQATSPDQLLQRIRSERAAEQEAMAAREREFLNARNEQASLLSQAKKALAAEEAESARLKALFEAQETQLAEQEKLLSERVGDLGALFAVLRQSAGDIAGQWEDSLLNVQYPERLSQLFQLSESRGLPTSEDIDRFWMTVLEDLAATGRVEQLSLPVVQTDGSKTEQSVLRIGPFAAFTDQSFLLYDAASSVLVVPERQPSGIDAVPAFLSSPDDVATLPVDVTRGSLLAQLQQEPELLDRVHHGGVVGYLILALGAVGVLLAIARLIYLVGVGSKVSRQMKDLDSPRTDNPLGRVLGVLGPNPQLSDLEALELKLDEAILLETPPLDKGHGLLKLLSAVAPLLGLLGTVTGMILTFQAITQSGGGDARLMADGISQALVTTVLGLVVAIPLLFLHSLLASRSKALVQILEQQSAGLIALHLSGAGRRG